MNKLLLLFVVTFTLCKPGVAQEIIFSSSDWENPSVFEKGQNEPHAFHIPYSNREEALNSDKKTGENYQLLNGQWKFKWVEKPSLVPEGFYQVNYNVKNWDEITVPASWQMEGYGHPKFRNITHTFESNPPFIPEYYNPTGCYKRTFNVPANWHNKEVMLRFEGVKSASYVWVNGERVGYNQGGFEPAEYNITKYLKKGKNDLSVQVIRFCDGSYLEDQDMWRLSGIFRDVKLYAQSKVSIHDFYFTTDLDDEYKNAVLDIELDVKNYLETDVAGYSVTVDVYNEQNKSILNAPLIKNYLQLVAGQINKIKLKAQVDNPLKWSAEFPNLYTILFELKDENGKSVEAFSKKLGFREVEIINEAILVNGVAIKFNGVNSHMHHPRHGQSVPLDVLKKDLLIMKQFNINCVRTCHYPPSPEYLDLADELGMYIFDEVSVEAHENIWLSSDTSYTEMYKDRSRKLVYRDRNHTSVVVWSAGNESGSGENIHEVIKTGLAIDPSRPGWMYGGNTFLIPFEDITGPRYWLPLQVKNLAEHKVLGPNDHRPSFMDEYLAATGNGLGGLDEYWELIWKYPRLTGGAIWDWISPGVYTPLWITPDASTFKNDGAIMGRPLFVKGKNGRGLKFSGHDDWVEFYRSPSLDITGKELSISFWVNPSEIPQPNTFITKGLYQYGIIMENPENLEFYIHSDQRISAKTKVPANWYGNWHHVAGIYDGQSLQLYIDDELTAETKFSGSISSTPFPLCIGREAETQDQGQYSGRLSSMIIDDVMVFDKVVEPKDFQTATIKNQAVLALDFETDKNEGEFFAIGLGGRTYGIVWPDRQIQPEIYQIKKSAQPVKVEALDLENGLVKITNRHNFKNLNEFNTVWELLVNGKMVQSGRMDVSLAPQESAEVIVPFKKIQTAHSGEIILTVSFRLKEKTNWADANHEVAWDQMIFPASKSEITKEVTGTTSITTDENQNEILIVGSQFEYVFDKQSGTLSKMTYKNTNYLSKGPEFNVWRAPLANDVDPWGANEFMIRNFTPGKGRSIDNQLRTLGLDQLQVQVDQVEVRRVSDSEVKIIFNIFSNSADSLPLSAFERNEIWTVYGDGTMELEQEVIPQGLMPDLLPRVGMQFQLAKSFDIVEWYGSGPFETYPDRKTGAKIGVYKSNADKEYVPYIMPQDYGNHTDVRWLTIANAEGNGLMIKSEQLLNFSFQKYSTDNLERAAYTYQLTEVPFNTLNVDYEVSGVGGTAIRQLEKYRVKTQVKTYYLSIKPF
ncbi:MAG: glycoside hydrolase family 2 TIM barrel-domain containing protein [Prolixibacteraceae bacterium]